MLATVYQLALVILAAFAIACGVTFAAFFYSCGVHLASSGGIILYGSAACVTFCGVVGVVGIIVERPFTAA